MENVKLGLPGYSRPVTVIQWIINLIKLYLL